MTFGTGIAIASGCAMVCVLAIWAPQVLGGLGIFAIIALGLYLLA